MIELTQLLGEIDSVATTVPCGEPPVPRKNERTIVFSHFGNIVYDLTFDDWFSTARFSHERTAYTRWKKMVKMCNAFIDISDLPDIDDLDSILESELKTLTSAVLHRDLAARLTKKQRVSDTTTTDDTATTDTVVDSDSSADDTTPDVLS